MVARWRASSVRTATRKRSRARARTNGESSMYATLASRSRTAPPCALESAGIRPPPNVILKQTTGGGEFLPKIWPPCPILSKQVSQREHRRPERALHIARSAHEDRVDGRIVVR